MPSAKSFAKPHAKPFFLGIGFHKPHPPFMVPKKYFDLHPLEGIELPPYREDDLDDIPAVGQRKAIGAGTHEAIVKAVREVFSCTPKAMIEALDLRKPIYRATAAYGHFGRDGFSWEKIDKDSLLYESAKN